MSKRSQEKRKARSKEKAKQMRRERGASPLARLVGGAEGEGVECWKQYDPEGLDRMVNYVVFRKVRGGGFVGAFFLVDYLCIGLKDAFCRLDVAPSEVVATFKSRDGGLRTVRVEGAEVRREVGAAVRWAREQEFRLPRDWERSLKVLGGEVDVAGAEVVEFGTEEGGLYYVGLERDLEKRLMKETLEEFLEREDVGYEFMDGREFEEEDFEEEEEGDEEGATGLRFAAEQMIEGMERGVGWWCEKKGMEVPDGMAEAIRWRALGMLAMARDVVQGKEENAAEAAERYAMEEIDKMEDAGDREVVRWAYGVLMEYLKSLLTGTDPGSEVPEDWEGEEWVDVDEMEAEFEEKRKLSSEKIAGAIREWCLANGHAVHPKLEQAMELITQATAHGLLLGDPEDEETLQASRRAEEQLLELEEPGEREGIKVALGQVREFMRTFGSRGEAGRALGLEGKWEEVE